MAKVVLLKKYVVLARDIRIIPHIATYLLEG